MGIDVLNGLVYILMSQATRDTPNFGFVSEWKDLLINGFLRHTRLQESLFTNQN
jgi:hypothetical protein